MNGRKREYIGPNLVHTSTHDREMKHVIEVSDEEQFAKGQNSRNLQVCSDAGDVETQSMEAIDSPYDFFRFLPVATRGIANNQRSYLKMETNIQEQADAGIEVVSARLNYLAEATPKPVNYAYDPPAGVPRQSGKHVAQTVAIRNGRKTLDDLSLDTGVGEQRNRKYS